MPSARPWPGPGGRAALLAVLALLMLALGLAGCERGGESARMYTTAQQQWEAGRHEEAARSLATLVELYPSSRHVEEALFLLASLQHHYLDQSQRAIHTYQSLLTQFPDGDYAADASLALASLYESGQTDTHRAVQIYRRLQQDEGMAEEEDWLQYRIAQAYLEDGQLGQAREAYRNLLSQHPESPLRPEAFYDVAYSYYLERQTEVALAAFRKTAEAYPGSEVAVRARFFEADILEEQGELNAALEVFESLEGRYHNEAILDGRIQTLRARLKRSAR